jgi:hypothetical protein
MLQEYHQVDLTTGERIEVYMLDPEVDEIPEGFVEPWGPRRFFNPVYDFTLGDWVEGADPSIRLEEVKRAKVDELDAQCSASILGGFQYELDGVPYHFSLSLPAQANFQGANALFQEGKVTTKRWTVLNLLTGKVDRIDIDKVTFEQLKMVVDDLIDGNVSRFRDELEPLVWAATTIEEVQAIIW